MEVNTIAKGNILIARPVLNDFTFNRTVVFLTEHNEAGSVGFILNKPLEHSISMYVSGLEDSDFPVHKGGPVETDKIYYLHKRPDLIRESEKITESIYWSGNFDDARRAIYNRTIQNNEIRFYLGYSGWESGQLQDEVDRNSWIVMQNDVDIFDNWGNNLWQEQLKKLGGENLLWVNSPSDPSMN